MTVKRPPRGRPAFSTEQHGKILELLRAAGPKGIRRSDLLYKHHLSQCGARIHELENMGWVIHHEDLPEDQRENGIRTRYVLQGEPLEPLSKDTDWYAEQFGSRPSSQKPIGPGPLFAGNDAEETS